MFLKIILGWVEILSKSQQYKKILFEKKKSTLSLMTISRTFSRVDIIKLNPVCLLEQKISVSTYTYISLHCLRERERHMLKKKKKTSKNCVVVVAVVI